MPSTGTPPRKQIAMGEIADLVADYTSMLDRIATAERLAAQAADDLSFAEAEIARLKTLPTMSPSGAAMPTVSRPGWNYIWGEDFNTPAPRGSFDTIYANTVQSYPDTYFDTSRNAGRPAATQGQYDTARVVSVQNSICEKWLHTEGTRPKVAALLPKLPTTIPSTKWTYRLYGRQEVRARVIMPGPGFKFAWLLWPQSDSRMTDGEIDGPEQNFRDLGHCSFFIHHTTGTIAPEQYGTSITTDLTQWHTFTREWSPGRVRQLVDGVVVQDHTERIPNTPMRWVLQTETEISATPPNPLIQTVVQIDWAAAWGLA